MGLANAPETSTLLNLPGDEQELREWLATPDWSSPWPWNSDLIANIRERRLQYEVVAAKERKSEFGPDPAFVPRESEGWYVRQLCAFAKIVEMAVDGNRPWEAVENALLFGATFTEFRLKFDWDKDAVLGRKLSAHQAEASALRRKGSSEERVAKVTAYVEAGHSATWACARVGREQGVTGSAVEKDYWNKKRHTSVD